LVPTRRRCRSQLCADRRNSPLYSAYAAYGGIIPANPFSLWGGGWGACEIAGRVSTMNLNDQLGTTNGVAGGQQTIYSAGLNWYVNGNIRLMFDYLHGNIAKQISPTNSGNAGARFDAFAMRTRVAF
jgi:phosphate-selective porin OprO and OprP